MHICICILLGRLLKDQTIQGWPKCHIGCDASNFSLNNNITCSRTFLRHKL